jgi:hypothetical protein
VLSPTTGLRAGPAPLTIVSLGRLSNASARRRSVPLLPWLGSSADDDESPHLSCPLPINSAAHHLVGGVAYLRYQRLSLVWGRMLTDSEADQLLFVSRSLKIVPWQDPARDVQEWRHRYSFTPSGKCCVLTASDDSVWVRRNGLVLLLPNQKVSPSQVSLSMILPKNGWVFITRSRPNHEGDTHPCLSSWWFTKIRSVRGIEGPWWDDLRAELPALVHAGKELESIAEIRAARAMSEAEERKQAEARALDILRERYRRSRP